MINEEKSVDDSPPVCFVQLSAKAQTPDLNSNACNSTPSLQNAIPYSLHSTPEIVRVLDSPVAATDLLNIRFVVTIAENAPSQQVDISPTTIGIQSTCFSNVQTSMPSLSCNKTAVNSNSCDFDDDLDLDERPLTVDLSKDSESSPLHSCVQVKPTEPCQPVFSSPSVTSSPSTTILASSVVSTGALKLSDHSIVENHVTVQSVTDAIVNKSRSLKETKTSDITSNSAHVTSSPFVAPIISTPDPAACTSSFVTGLLDIRPKPVASLAPSATTSSMSITHPNVSHSAVHLMPYTGPIISNQPSMPFGAPGLPIAGPGGNPGNPGGLQILNMTPMPQFVGTPGIVLHSAGASHGFQAHNPSLLQSMNTAPLGPGPPLNFLHPSTFSTTLLQPPGVDFLMDPSMGLAHHYNPSNPLTFVNHPVLDPLSPMYPSFVHPHSNQTFLVTSSSVLIPPSYRPSLAGNTSIVNATAPQMSTSAGNLFPGTLSNASATGGPLYLHPTQSPMLSPSFAHTPSSIYAQQYPAFSIPTWQGTLDPVSSWASVIPPTGNYCPRTIEDPSTCTPLPICRAPPVSSNDLSTTSKLSLHSTTNSKKLPLPVSSTSSSRALGSPLIQPAQPMFRPPPMRNSTATGLVPTYALVDQKLSRTVGIRSPTCNNLLLPLRRRRPVHTEKAKSSNLEEHSASPTPQSLSHSSSSSSVAVVSALVHDTPTASTPLNTSMIQPESSESTEFQTLPSPIATEAPSGSTERDTVTAVSLANGYPCTFDSPVKPSNRTSTSSSLDNCFSPVNRSTSNESVSINGFRESGVSPCFSKRSADSLVSPPHVSTPPSSTPLEATGLHPVSRKPLVSGSPRHAMPPPVLILGPDSHRILTHYVDGHVIYESNKPFPIRNGMAVVEAALKQQQQCSTDGPKHSNPPTPSRAPAVSSSSLTNGFAASPAANGHLRSPASVHDTVSKNLFNSDVPSENVNPNDTPNDVVTAKPVEQHQLSPPLHRTKQAASSDTADEQLGILLGFRPPPYPHHLATSPMSSSTSNTLQPAAMSNIGSLAAPTNPPSTGITFPSHLVPQAPVPPPPGPVSKWTSEDVVQFVRGTPGCGAYADAFLVNEIDGEALLLLAQDQFIQPPIGMKIGPALKLAARLESIRYVN